MLRAEIGLFLVMAFIAYFYFSAEKKHSLLHETFSALLVAVLINAPFWAYFMGWI